VPLGDLALLNFRGDLGAVGDGGGCSDLAWRRRESFIAHNEDGSEFFHGRSAMLTLALEGRPSVTAARRTSRHVRQSSSPTRLTAGTAEREGTGSPGHARHPARSRPGSSAGRPAGRPAGPGS
jgi:hypothetical protein